MKELDANRRDRLVSVAKGAAGALPFVGSLIGEALDTVIPDLRFERVVAFLKALEERVVLIEERTAAFEEHLKTQEGLDILEEGIIQASRAVSAERQERLAMLVAKTLSVEELRYEESRKLLNLFRELTDPEIVWLIYYSLSPMFGPGPHADWVAKHPDILKPISREYGAPQEQQERAALQDSYKATLLRFGLTEEQPNRSAGLTTLGRMLVSYIRGDDISTNS